MTSIESELPAIEPLLAVKVRVILTTGRSIYYGILVDADAAFVLLHDVEWGWYGDAGWWRSGKAETTALSTANVLSITPGEVRR